ncbi:MAG: hypothetical protein H7174_09940 [Flavobacterium sp.]|nr:hypothetical protein [Flavobacterium sp.]
MNEITDESIKEFLFKEKLDFNPTHSKLSIPVINRIYKKLVNGIRFDEIKVNGNLIIDGHHRYISSMISKIEIGYRNYPKTSATSEFDWKEVKFVNEEWDTLDKIQYLNELDAKHNNIPLEKLISFNK